MTPVRAEIKVEFNPTNWVDMYGDYLFSFAISRVRNEAAAEDLVQETLLAAMQSRSNFGGQSSERTWLCGILKHKIIDYYRRRSREVELDQDDTDVSGYEFMYQADGPGKGHWTAASKPTAWNEDPESALEHAEFRVAVSNCLGKLPERVANVFTLRELDGYDSVEICEYLQITQSNFWVMMHRARLHLRRCVDLNWFKRASH